MGRRIRVWEADGIYHISNRCAGARHLLVPSPEVNAIIRGALTRYAVIHGVILYGWVFMSNHFHLIVKAPQKNISAFMRDVQRTISSRIKELESHEDWDTSVFPKRFKAEKILDDAALKEKILYVAMNPVEAGLVPHPEKWPGVSSWRARCSGEAMEGAYLSKGRLSQLRRRAERPDEVGIERAMLEYEVEVTNPPAKKGMSVAEFGEEIAREVEARCADVARRRRQEGKRAFLGAERVRRLDPLSKPDAPAHSPHPLCHTSDPAKREAYRAFYARVESTYEQQGKRWRAKKVPVRFPAGTFPPGWARVTDGTAIPPEMEESVEVDDAA